MASAAVVAVVGGFAVTAGLAEVVAAVGAAEVGGRNTASEADRAVESLNRGSEVLRFLAIKEISKSMAQSRPSAKLFSPIIGIGSPPSPHPKASVPHPRFWREGHTRWRERGWRSPNSDEGTYSVLCGTLYMYILCGQSIV